VLLQQRPPSPLQLVFYVQQAQLLFSLCLLHQLFIWLKQLLFQLFLVQQSFYLNFPQLFFFLFLFKLRQQPI